MVSTEASERFLAAPWLADLDPASRQAVLNILVERHADPGDVLLEQGQKNDRINFLIGGVVTVSRTFPGGRVETVVTLNAPSVFGESTFFRAASVSLVRVQANSPVWLLTLDRDAHTLLRRHDPRAAEQLALAAVRVLAERFDELDRRVSDYIGSKPEGHPRSTEWANFRARLFEESNI